MGRANEAGYEAASESMLGVRVLPLLPESPDEGWSLRVGEQLDLAAADDGSIVADDLQCVVSLTAVEGGVEVSDAGGRRGLYIPLLSETELQIGDELLLGTTLVRICEARADENETVCRRAASDDETVVERGNDNVTRLPGSTVVASLQIQSVYEGPMTTINIDAVEVLIGAEDGDIVIVDDAAMCPVHALIFAYGGTIRVLDLDSAEGTFRRVRDGERIALGHPMAIGTTLLTTERLEADPLAPVAVALL